MILTLSKEDTVKCERADHCIFGNTINRCVNSELNNDKCCGVPTPAFPCGGHTLSSPVIFTQQMSPV